MADELFSLPLPVSSDSLAFAQQSELDLALDVDDFAEEDSSGLSVTPRPDDLRTILNQKALQKKIWQGGHRVECSPSPSRAPGSAPMPSAFEEAVREANGGSSARIQGGVDPASASRRPASSVMGAHAAKSEHILPRAKTRASAGGGGVEAREVDEKYGVNRMAKVDLGSLAGEISTSKLEVTAMLKATQDGKEKATLRKKLSAMVGIKGKK
eukprot:CAMPEP_0184708936 /NCGR_PEP_ID=MMETSP0314-20130426/137_1 /TAXON_ID=38298 /ORGANISM="Rhodella maculata, Strain CCMP 736" /LENGTH=211 /DNA_ID=CAMNT_0027170557 /DNA_START=89 /DNA_END=727 /DNA_ORIENTATION=+